MGSHALAFLDEESATGSSTIASSRSLLTSLAARSVQRLGLQSATETLRGTIPSPTAPSPSKRLDQVHSLRDVKTEAASKQPISRASQRKTLIQEWEGIIDAIDGDVFRGHMRPILGEKRSDEFTEFGEFDIGSLSAGDREVVAVGIRFRWCIGVIWEGTVPYDYQQLYIPKHIPMTAAEERRVQSDVERFLELFPTK